MELIVLYLFPSFLALCFGHRDKVAILMLNILLGWTIIGWIFALIWSFKK